MIKKIFFTLMGAQTLQPVCPMCAATVGAGIGLAHYLGVDDTIAGLWIGGFLASLISWTINILSSCTIIFYGRNILITFVYLSSTFLALYYFNYIGVPGNTLGGFDKLSVGIVCGLTLFVLAFGIHTLLKKHNHNTSYIPFQKVLIPLVVLSGGSIVFYLLTR